MTYPLWRTTLLGSSPDPHNRNPRGAPHPHPRGTRRA